MLTSASSTGVVASSTSSEWLIALTNPACSSVEKNNVPIPATPIEQGLYKNGEMTPDDVQRYFEEVHEYYSSLPAEQFPVLASIADDMIGFDGEDRLRFGIDVMIAGLEAVDRAGWRP
jgi:hypothetical protein